jgi:DNA mismatch repair protein MutL
MSSRISILPDTVINKIAAGEVVERPASVVKELIENSIDSGATEISVDIEQAGRRLIRVVDNGSGMSPEDARLAFERHATSKIRHDSDLASVRTMGFRGEALSSIASVSQVTMTTAEPGSVAGVLVEIEGGAVRNVSAAAAAKGTSIEIGHLLYNTPARLKFLKSPATEFSHILTALSRQAVAHPTIRFRLTHNKKQVLDLPACRSEQERVFQLYGKEIAENVIELSGGRDTVLLHGLIGKPGYSRADKTFQEFFVNRRAVRNASLSHALASAYADLLMRDRHPVAFLFIDMDPALVDVNVHPAKTEVRFRNQAQVHDLIRDAIRERLRTAGAGRPAGFSGGVHEAVADYLGSQDLRMPERGQGYIGPSAYRGTDAAGYPPFIAEKNDAAWGPVGSNVAPLLPQTGQLYPLCQVHDSFIVAQSEDGMALIDQHAAHERVLFEKLQDQYQGGAIAQQNLLLPVQLEPGHAEQALLSDCLSDLQKLGFGVEEFGAGTFLIKAVPALMTGADYRQLVLDILDEIGMHGTGTGFEKIRDEILSVMACHPAIKVHRRLSIREMEDLLRDLSACRMPHSCPHGRPTVVRFSLGDINKMFKRI